MVDARGFSCPMPVVMTKKAIEAEHPATLEVRVDEAVAKENVSRLAQSYGYTVEVVEEADEFKLVLTKC